jgi:hypothetical protein
MRTSTELQEKIDHLIAYKEELHLHFKIIDMSKQKNAILAAFYRTVDNEIAMLRWALGEVEQTWSDDMSGHIDMECYFDSLPPTEFGWQPNAHQLRANVKAAARKVDAGPATLFPCLRCGEVVCIASHNICGSCLPEVFADPSDQWADEAANQVPFHLKA